MQQQSENATTLIRELAPVSGGILFHSTKCPDIDEAKEDVFALSSVGTRRLPSASERNEAAKKGDRLFAVTRLPLPAFRAAVSNVCTEDGCDWDHLLIGTLSVADAPKLIDFFIRQNGDAPIQPIDTSLLFSRVQTTLDPVLRDQIRQARRDLKYTIDKIRKENILPVSFWERVANEKLAPFGLRLSVSESVFRSTDAELKQQQLKALQAEKELLEKQRIEAQMALEKECREEELEAARRNRQTAQKQFELQQAELDAKLKQIEIDMKVAEFQKMEAAKLEIEKARNDEEIRKANATMGNAENFSRQITQAFDEACKRVEDLVNSLANLGVSKDTLESTPPRPSVTPPCPPSQDYPEMSDAFRNILSTIRNRADGGVCLSWEAYHCSNGFQTRDLIAGSKRNDTTQNTGTLRIGDRIVLRLTSRRNGYLTLFNFGTSGKISKIFPAPEFGTTDNRIVANHEYTLPGELMPSRNFSDGWWTVNGPVSAQNNLPERIIAILTESPITLSESCFTGGTKSTLFRGGFAAVEETISTLADLPPGSWCFGMLEAWIQN